MSICILRTILRASARARAVLSADLEGGGAWADRDIGAKISSHVTREEMIREGTSRLMRRALCLCEN